MTQVKFSTEKMLFLKKLLCDEFLPRIKGRSIHYVDTPTHLNIGDLLIMLGTEELFRQADVKIKSVSSLRNTNLLLNSKIDKDDIIICHGGGNFGDLYLGTQDHQALRLEIVQKYPDNQIIMMPQSVHFEDSIKLKESTQILKEHNNLLIYVRDIESFNLLNTELGGRIKMMPDMAHMLFGKYQISKLIEENTLILRRRDKESQIDSSSQQNYFDWDDIFRPQDLRFYDFMRFLCRIEDKLSFNLGSAWIWSKFSTYIARRAQNLYDGYSVIDTDRLHGAIFGLLCGKNLILQDNSYKKIARYFSKWILDV